MCEEKSVLEVGWSVTLDLVRIEQSVFHALMTK